MTSPRLAALVPFLGASPHLAKRLRALRQAAMGLALAAPLAGCDLLNSKPPTGDTHLGAFNFVATNTADTCLSSRYGASMTFPASLSRTGDLFFFTGPGGSVKGAIVGSTFTVGFGGQETISTVCQIARDETITGTFESPTRVTGTYHARVIPVTGTNCLAAVVSATRQFATLPCEVRYTLIAERTDTPDGGVDGGVDGGTAPGDGGTNPVDGGTTPTDGGTTLADGGTLPLDGGA